MIYHTRMRNMAEAISVGQAPVEQRLAYIRLRSSFGKVVPVTHHKLARMAGTRWVISIRMLSVLKRQGVAHDITRESDRGGYTEAAGVAGHQKAPCHGRDCCANHSKYDLQS